jgi:membrane protease YdiL (CAAX protease family)
MSALSTSARHQAGHLTGSTTGDLLCGLSVFVAGTFAAGVGLQLPWIIAVAWQGALGAAVLVLHLRNDQPHGVGLNGDGLGLHMPGSPVLWFGLANVAAIAFGYGVSGAVIGMGEQPFSLIAPGGPNPYSRMAETARGWAVLAAYSVLAAPLIEEFAFRGWIMRSLQVRVGTWPAILLAAAAFALMHAWYGRALFLVIPFALGAVWGACAMQSRSIWTAIILHGTWNLVILIGAVPGSDPLWMFPAYGSRMLAIGIPAMTALVALATLRMAARLAEARVGAPARVEHTPTT